MNNFLKKFFAFLRKDLIIAISYKFNLFMQILGILFVISLIFFSFNDPMTSLNQMNDRNVEFFKVLVGIALIDFMFSSMSVFSREVRLAQTHGTFEALILTKTSILTILLSSYALTFARSILRILIYILISKFLFEIDISLINIPPFLALVIYNSIPFIGIGLFAASFIILFKVGNIINFLVGLTSIFFSGIFFSIEVMPDYLINISNNLPLTISLGLSKEALFGSLNLLDASQDLLKVLFMSIFFLPAGILLVYYSFKAAKKNGNLNYY